MKMKVGIACFVVLLALNSISSFVDTAEASNENIKKSDSSADADDSREKISQEDIMFGNQQNKGSEVSSSGNSMTKDVVLQKDHDSQEHGNNDTTEADDAKLEDMLNDSSKEEDKRGRLQDDLEDLNEMGAGGSEVASKWAPVSPNALHYMLRSPSIQQIPVVDDDIGGLYSQDQMYRRKRQLISGRPVVLRKRSLRMPLGQMIQTRGRRLPRRSMRLKRQVDVEELLSLLSGNGDGRNGNESPAYTEEAIANSINHYRYGQPSYRYPNYPLREEDAADTESETEAGADFSDRIRFPQGDRYLDLPDFHMQYHPRQQEEADMQPNWVEREHIPRPSVFRVSRRSSPLFYPIDYRYVPGYKKRTILEDEDQSDGDYGKWGKIVQLPEAYASAEDVAKLYALANLMARNDDEDNGIRSG